MLVNMTKPSEVCPQLISTRLITSLHNANYKYLSVLSVSTVRKEEARQLASCELEMCTIDLPSLANSDIPRC